MDGIKKLASRTRQMLSFAMTDNFAVRAAWEGRKELLPLKDSKIVGTIFRKFYTRVFIDDVT